MLLIGSKSLLHFGDKFISSFAERAWDNDWICSYDDFLNIKRKIKVKRTNLINENNIVVFTKDNNIHEFDLAWEERTSYELLQIASKDESVAIKYDNHLIATPDLVFTLKKSHRFLRNSPHFLKTMHDYNHLQSLGCKIPESLTDWYKKREKETYDYNHPKLDVSKDEFFSSETIKYVYDHDTIHLAVAHLKKPAYEYFKEDKAEVKCSRDLFEALPEQIKVYAVLEEAYVLALERSQIPFPGCWPPRKSFEYALFKVCSSITSGFFREYAYCNYFKVLDMYSDSYLDKFNAGVNSGLVKKL